MAQNPLPSPFLVNYMFAVAVVQLWGVNLGRIEEHPNYRPPPPMPQRTAESATAEEDSKEVAAPVSFDPHNILLAAPFCLPGAQERMLAREEGWRAAEAEAELQEQRRVEESVSEWMQGVSTNSQELDPEPSQFTDAPL